MLDPTKEISAEQMMCENGFSTRAESAIRLNGSEFRRNVSELRSENMALKDANEATQKVSDAINQEYIKQSANGGNSDK